MTRTLICTCIVAAALMISALPAGAQGPARTPETFKPPMEREAPNPAGPGNLLLFQPPPGTDTLIFSDSNCDFCGGGQQSLAENFFLNVDQDIIFLEWWGAFFPNGKPPGTAVFDINVYNDAAGIPDKPGGAKCSLSGVIPVATPTGAIVAGVPEILYQVAIDPGVCNLLGGAVYWLEIYNTTVNATDDWGWEDAFIDPNKGLLGIAFALETPGQAWNFFDGFEMAVAIYGQDKDGGGPPNDTCDTKVQVDCDSVTAGTITGATDDDPDCFSSGIGPSVWYSIDVPFNADVTASFCKQGATFEFDTVLDIYDGGCDALSCVTSNDDSCGLGSEVTWAANAGERYEIRVGTFSGVEGNFDLAVNCEPLCDGVALDAPAKVTAGEKFDMNISCANADARILVACGRRAESSTRFVPGCGVVNFGVGPRANNFGTTTADGDGNATSSQTLGDNFGNNSISCQVVDTSKCETSNVVTIDINKGK